MFGNTLIGTCHHQLFGKLKFEDKANNIVGYLNIGHERKRPKDYFSGYIEQNGEIVCDKIFGNYMGYADCDGQRYFDVRHMDNYELQDLPKELSLASDSRNRIDICELE